MRDVDPSLLQGGVCVCFLAAVVLLSGCATTAPPVMNSSVTRIFPADALVTQRVVLKARGREYALNGYTALSATGARRLIVTQAFGQVVADVLVKSDGSVQVVRSSPMLRAGWIQRYVVADLLCLFGGARGAVADCPLKKLGENHFLIERRWYTLDVRIVETKAGPQPPEMFLVKPGATP